MVEIAKALAWPTVVVLAILVFHRPLARFLEALGGRVTKFSAFNVSVELIQASRVPAFWSDPAIFASSHMLAGDVTSTTMMGLVHRIADQTGWQYLIVDIGSGRRWLISRLYLYTAIFYFMRRLRCVVFVETRDEMRQRLLGLATPDAVLSALAKNYPWFEHTFVQQWRDRAPDSSMLSRELSPDSAQQVAGAFIDDERIRLRREPEQPTEWEALGDPTFWEHTKWLDLEHVNGVLRPSFLDRDASRLLDTPDVTNERRNGSVIRRQAAFVALVNDKGEFKTLIDRQALVERLAARAQEAAGEEKT